MSKGAKTEVKFNRYTKTITAWILRDRSDGVKAQKVLIVVFFLMIASHCVSAATQVPMNRTLTQLTTYDNMIVLVFDPPYANDQNCFGPYQDRAVAIKLNPDDTGTYVKNKVLYASALTAYMSKRKVGFGVSGGCATWGDGIPYIYRIDMAP